MGESSPASAFSPVLFGKLKIGKRKIIKKYTKY
jgi:hypothetical protein